MKPEQRILFFGYSEPGYACLKFLVEHGYDVAALITHEDNPGEQKWFKTPAEIARAHGIPVHTPASVNKSEWIEKISAMGCDLILSVYYRNLISAKILQTARLGAFNMHGSLLPQYRGCAPINWAIIHGESRIGMTLHRMVAKADAGAVVDQEGVEIGPATTAHEAYERVVPCAEKILARQIDALLAGAAVETPQDESKATYFRRRGPEDGRINWRQTSVQIFNLIRAVTSPYPGAFSDVGDARLLVWWAEPDGSRSGGASQPGEILSLDPLIVATGDGALTLTRTEWRGSPAAPLRVGLIL